MSSLQGGADRFFGNLLGGRLYHHNARFFGGDHDIQRTGLLLFLGRASHQLAVDLGDPDAGHRASERRAGQG